MATPDLLKLYELALQEYRFQVLLNWDRAKHSLLTNGAMLGAAAVLLKGGGSKWYVVAVCALVAVNSAIGALGVSKGHEYYARTRKTKTELEKKLGLAAVGLEFSTTPGMREGHAPEEAPLKFTSQLARRWGRLKTQLQLLLWSFVGLAVLGILSVVL